MQENDRYILQLKFKEVVLAEKSFSLNGSMTDYLVTLKPNKTLANGGLLTVNLYKLSMDFVMQYASNSIKIEEIDAPMVMNWTQPKGEIIVIQKPSSSLQVEITLDTDMYSPGDAVNY